LAAAPRIVTRGLVYQPNAADLLDGIAARAQELIDKHRFADDKDLAEAVRRSLEGYIYTETKRRPLVTAVLSPAYLT
jgi:mRNA degradation ribonuclease J1/J2